MPPLIVRAVSMLGSSPTPEGRCCPISRPPAIGVVSRDRSRATPEVVLDQLISRRCQDLGFPVTAQVGNGERLRNAARAPPWSTSQQHSGSPTKPAFS